MIPVHVLISGSQADEQRYADAFGGAVDLYRFRTNVEAIERLATAQTPVHVLIVTPHQESLFNATAAQLVERLAGPGFGTSPVLHGMQVVVVGEQVPPAPRVHAVSTLDAAIRLVKFGEVESAPSPMPQAPVAAMPTHELPVAGYATAAAPQQPGLASSVISAIWDSPGAPAAAQAAPPAQQAPVQVQAQQVAPPTARVQVPRGNAQAVQGGGPARPAGLFAAEPDVAVDPATGLQPARPYELASRGEYRGDGRRANVAGPSQTAGVINARTSAPVPGAGNVPPALAQQVQQLIYPGASTPTDPLLGFSESIQREVAAMHAAEGTGTVSAMQVMAQAATAGGPYAGQAMPAMGGMLPVGMPQPGAQLHAGVAGGGPGGMPPAAPSGRKRGRFARSSRKASKQAAGSPLRPNAVPMAHASHGMPMQPGAPIASPMAQAQAQAPSISPAALAAAGGDPFIARTAMSGDVSFG